VIRLLDTNRRVSPLTGLPGNVQIQAEMKKRLLKQEKNLKKILASNVVAIKKHGFNPVFFVQNKKALLSAFLSV